MSELRSGSLHDSIYRALAASKSPLTLDQLLQAENANSLAVVERKLADLRRDFHVQTVQGKDGVERYQLGEFKGFTGQADHHRHDYMQHSRDRVS